MSLKNEKLFILISFCNISIFFSSDLSGDEKFSLFNFELVLLERVKKTSSTFNRTSGVLIG